MKNNKRKVRKAVGIAGASNSKRNYGDRTEILKSAIDNPTKALVVYQPSITSV